MGSLSDSGGRPLVLLTGATGYIGGRLLKGLEKAGWPIRCLARHPEFLQPRVAPSTEVVKGDCFDQASLPPAMTEVHTKPGAELMPVPTAVPPSARRYTPFSASSIRSRSSSST